MSWSRVMYSCSLWTSHSCWKWIKYFYGVSQERGFMAPRISLLYCLIIIASLIDCRAGEFVFGCFLRFSFAVCRRKTLCILHERKCFWSVNLSWLTPHLTPLFSFHCGNEAHCTLWYVRPDVHFPVILRFLHIQLLIAISEWLKAL